jgi:lipid II:glycine glycyltransferase (peptidoglycan interpeptide bridge formation enzyme)
MISTDLDFQRNSWNKNIANLPHPHILQTWEWGQSKSRFGWTPKYRLWPPESNNHSVSAAAMVLQRKYSLGSLTSPFRILYVPKGPLLDWSNRVLRRQVLEDLATIASMNGAIFIKIDPDVAIGEGIPGTDTAQIYSLSESVISDLRSYGWHLSHEQIQYKNTILVDLTPDEDTLLARMKQKTRYNIRLSTRKGVTCRVGSRADIGTLYRLYAETSTRDGFAIRDESYYRTIWETFFPIQENKSEGNDKVDKHIKPFAIPILAEVAGEVIAAVIIFLFAGKAWYLYGMSRVSHREKMPNYLLQWEAMKCAKGYHCTEYDLWGAPDEFTESDPLWGVYRFKEGFGGKVVRHIGAWDLPLKPNLYRLYTNILPRLLEIMRRRGKSRTIQSLNL